MRTLNGDQCEAWRAVTSARAETADWKHCGGSAIERPGDVSETSVKRAASLSRGLCAWLLADGQPREVLFWIRENGVWESSEDLNLYHSWRRSFGEAGAATGRRDEGTVDAGHLFAPDECEHVVSLSIMSLVFGWGIVVLAAGSDRAVHADHDGHVWVTGELAEELRAAERLFARCGGTSGQGVVPP